jgi:hypothetical protein
MRRFSGAYRGFDAAQTSRPPPVPHTRFRTHPTRSEDIGFARIALHAHPYRSRDSRRVLTRLAVTDRASRSSRSPDSLSRAHDAPSPFTRLGVGDHPTRSGTRDSLPGLTRLAVTTRVTFRRQPRESPSRRTRPGDSTERPPARRRVGADGLLVSARQTARETLPSPPAVLTKSTRWASSSPRTCGSGVGPSSA